MLLEISFDGFSELFSSASENESMTPLIELPKASTTGSVDLDKELRLIVTDEDFDLDVPATYCWMTLGQINNFLLYNNYINIQARSLIAAIPYV